MIDAPLSPGSKATRFETVGDRFEISQGVSISLSTIFEDVTEEDVGYMRM